MSGVVALIELEIDNVGAEASGMVFFQTAPKCVVMITVKTGGALLVEQGALYPALYRKARVCSRPSGAFPKTTAKQNTTV